MLYYIILQEASSQDVWLLALHMPWLKGHRGHPKRKVYEVDKDKAFGQGVGLLGCS